MTNDPQIEADITAHYIDKWFHHEITDEELEERLNQQPFIPPVSSFDIDLITGKLQRL